MDTRKNHVYILEVVEAACCWSIIAVWHLIEKYIGTSWIAAVAKQNKAKKTKSNQLYTKQNHRVEMTRYNKAGSQRIEQEKEKEKENVLYTLIWKYVKTEMKMPSNVPRSLQLSWVFDVDSKTQYKLRWKELIKSSISIFSFFDNRNGFVNKNFNKINIYLHLFAFLGDVIIVVVAVLFLGESS